MDLDSEAEENITALEYARQSGISFDYLHDPVRALPNVFNLVRQDAKAGWIGDDEVQLMDLGPPMKFEERLTVSREAAMLLAFAARPEPDSLHQELLQLLGDDRLRKKLKEEVPLLSYGPDTACKAFRRRDDFEIPLTEIRLPMELVDREKDEGIEWPTSSRNLGLSLRKRIDAEKLAITREALPFLQYPFGTTWTAQDRVEAWSSISQRDKQKAVAPITPPLTPLDTPIRPYEPGASSEGFDVPLTSDPPDLGHMELEIIQAKALQDDIPTPVKDLLIQHPDFLNSTTSDGTVRMQDIFSPMASLENSSPPNIEEGRTRRQDLKVETPLTPRMSIADPRKCVSFASIAREYNYNIKTPSPMPEFESRYFDEAFGPAHGKITRMCEQEQLSVADATARVEVPNIDLSLPDPPWKEFEVDHSRIGLKYAQLQLIKRTLVEADEKLEVWPGKRRTNDAVRWAPLTSTSNANITQESFPNDDQAWKKLVDIKESEVADSTSQTWKRPGLRILEEGDDEEDLDYGKFFRDGPEDIATLLKKRKLRLEEDERSQHRANGLGSAAATIRNQETFSRMQVKTQSTEFPGNLLGGPFSARDAIDNFMEIRGTKKIKHAESEFFLPNKATRPPQPVATAPHHTSLPVRKSPDLQSITLPAPQFEIPTDAFSIIMSTTMSSWKNIMRTLERTLPSLTLIERDFSSHNTTTWLQGSVQRSPVASPLAAEADFIVSPSVGIIVTTLQKAKAKPLPGHKGTAEIRERTEKVCLRYEKLLILVSEDNKAETTEGLYPADAEGLAAFIGFTCSLDCNVTVQYVLGGTKNLYQWLMAAIVQNRVNDTLLPEQTYWELFLRRAGMNAFAAQSVLTLLRPPEGTDASSPSKSGHFGLTAFVEMGRPMRLNRFAHICGIRMLERVSDVIDASWA